MRTIRITAFAALFMVCAVSFAQSETNVKEVYGVYVKPIEKRIALVIGNSYGTNQAFPKLRNSENDAKDFSRKLDSLGFDVRQYLNLELKEMENVVDSFCTEAKDYGVALVFFTGNGIRINHQDCYAANDSELGYGMKSSFVCIDDVMEKLEKSGCPLRIGLFDICRADAPIVLHKGSTILKADNDVFGMGEFRLFSSKRGETAYDGMGNHSPFYEAVAHVLNTYPEVSLADFERRVAEYVYEKTDRWQVVSSEKTMIGDFRFTIVKHD